MSVATMGRQQQVSARPLTAVECRSWLVSNTEGRLGYLSGRGPRWVVVCRSLSLDDKIVLPVPESNEIGQYAPGERATLDVDGMTPLGYRQTVRVSGPAELLPNLSVGALNGLGRRKLANVHQHGAVNLLDGEGDDVQAECSTGARERW